MQFNLNSEMTSNLVHMVRKMGMFKQKEGSSLPVHANFNMVFVIFNVEA